MKETVQAKEGITKTKKEVTTNPRQKEDYKNDYLFKTNVQFLNHHQVSEQRFQTQSGSKHAIS